MASKIRGEIPYFFGYSVMNIVSGSMEDTIPEGSYILIKKVDATEVRNGDIICFYSDDPAIKGYPNTHKVVEDPIYGENGIEFVTKGDANPRKDDYTAKGDKLIGRHDRFLLRCTAALYTRDNIHTILGQKSRFVKRFLAFYAEF